MLKRASKFGSAAALALMVGHAAGAQGVPIVDWKAFAEKLKIFEQMEKDEDTQVEKAQKRADLRDFREQQLAAIDRIIAGIAKPSGFGSSVSGGGGEAGSIEEVYAADVNPAGQYIFGDARENVEAVIIRGAADTYHLAGVRAAGLSPTQWRALLQALIKQESRFQIGARSPAAAFGLTQIIPGTAQDLGIYPAYYEDPYLQVTGGGRYLAEQLSRFNGNIVHALAAYNAGPGAVQKYGGVPPYAETQHYVQVIPRFYNEYLARIGGPEALGTINPALLAASEASFYSNGAMYFANYTHQQTAEALMRVREIVARIPEAASLKESIDLNSAMRSELALIVTLQIRQRAARSKSISALTMAHLAMQREAIDYITYRP